MTDINSRKFFLSMIFITLLVVESEAQLPKTINIVTTPVPFLRVSPDARAGGMGDVGIATSADANSIFWNMAKTVFAEPSSCIAINYTPWLRSIGPNTSMAAIAGYKKLKEGQSIAGSLRYFSLGDVQFTDFNGNYLQTYKPREFSIDFGYSKTLSERLSIGLNMRYINSSLARGTDGIDIYKTGNSVAGDVSIYYHGLNNQGSGFCWGINASNLGAKIGYTDNADTKEFIPANLGAGIAYTKAIDDDNKITFAIESNKLLVPELEYTGDANQDFINLAHYRQYSVAESWFAKNHSYNASVGTEYGYKNAFFARAGYFYEGKNQGGRKYVTAGIGVKYSFIGFDFSYLVPSGNGVTNSPLSNTIRFAVIFKQDK